jgi:hypothetical protein
MLKTEVMSYLVSDFVVSGELHVRVAREECGIFDVVDKAIFPLKRDRLKITYVKCSKTYVIKPSVLWIKKDLQFAGVIK